jgi:hypothetical protein
MLSPLVALNAFFLLAAAQSPLKPVAQWPLPKVNGKLLTHTDHLHIDEFNNRLYVSAKNLGTVFVLSLGDGSIIDGITVPNPQGLGISFNGGGHSSSNDLLWVGSDGSGLFSAFNISTGSRVFALNFSTTATDGETDDVEVDEFSGEVLVAVGDDGPGSADPSAIAIVDSIKGTVNMQIAMPGHIEGFSLIRGTNMIFANSPHATPNEVLLVARNTSGILARWPLPTGIGGNTPIVWDERERLIYVGCRDPPTLLVLDPATSSVVANSTQFPADNDDLYLDAQSGLMFASGGGSGAGKGLINVFQVRRGQIQFLGSTQPAGKNSIVDERARRVYTTVESDGTSAAFIAVYDY